MSERARLASLVAVLCFAGVARAERVGADGLAAAIVRAARDGLPPGLDVVEALHRMLESYKDMDERIARGS